MKILPSRCDVQVEAHHGCRQVRLHIGGMVLAMSQRQAVMLADDLVDEAEALAADGTSQ